jgi:diacylglycerol O-acyltransferase
MPAKRLNQRLSNIDAAFLYLERKEIPLHIAGLCVFDGEIPFAGFVKSIDSKLHLLPRYRQVVVDPPFHLGYPSWEDDQRFDIRRHIFHATLEEPGGHAELEALAGRILSQVMDRGKPLWDIHVIDGLAGGRSAILARIHHSLADGVAGASIMKIILDQSPSSSAPARKPRFRPAPHSAASRSVVDALAGALRGSVENMIAAETVLLDFSRTLIDDKTRDALEKLVGLLPEIAASSERFVFNKPCSGERKFCCTEFPLAEVQAVRAAAGGTINDVILTVVTRAVSRYLRAQGEKVAGRFLRIMCPVNVRQDRGESLGNRITFLPVVLPLDVRNPVALLHAVAERTEIMKNARAAHAIALLGTWIGAAPPPLQALFWGAIPQVPLPVALFHMICTNVPNSPTPLYAGERRMVAFYPHVPTGYELGVNCAFQSYDGRFFCGLTADANVVPDATRLRDLVRDSFGELRRAAVGRRRAARAPKAKPTAAEAAKPIPIATPAPVGATA